MNKTAIYWGTFLIAIGALLLNRSMGWIVWDLSMLIKLWPLFLIFWGLSIIKFPDIIRKILVGLSAIFLALFLFAIFTGGWSFTKHNLFHWKHAVEREIDRESVERAVLVFDSNISRGKLNLEFGAGTFRINEATDKSIEANGDNFSINDHRDSNSASLINIDIDAPRNGWIDKTIKGAFDLDLKLNKGIEWYMNAEFGAADVNMDLSQFNVPQLNINSGAASVVLKLGTIAPSQAISIDCGASDIFIRIPTEAGCRIESNTVLSGRDFEGFIESESGYTTSNYNQSSNKIDIKLNGAISNFNIVKY